jgi:hypothetical protein
LSEEHLGSYLILPSIIPKISIPFFNALWQSFGAVPMFGPGVFLFSFFFQFCDIENFGKNKNSPKVEK